MALRADIDEQGVGDVSFLGMGAEEGEADIAQAKGSKRGRPKGGGKAKAKAQTVGAKRARLAVQDNDSTEDGEDNNDGEASARKKCRRCKKQRSCTEFRKNQADCKNCQNAERSLQRLAERQNLTDWLAKLKTEKGGVEYNKLVVHYSRQEGSTVKRKGFCLHHYQETIIATSGTRTDNKKKMMWEGEYIEWACGAKGGYLTKQEAAANWQAFLDDPGKKKDDKGPRGFRRVEVSKGDYTHDYEDMSLQKAYIKSEKGKKSMTDKEADIMQKRLVSEHDRSSNIDVLGLRSRLRTAAASSNDIGDDLPTAMSSHGLMADELKEVHMSLTKSSQKKKRGGMGSDGELGDDSQAEIGDADGDEDEEADRGARPSRNASFGGGRKLSKACLHITCSLALVSKEYARVAPGRRFFGIFCVGATSGRMRERVGKFLTSDRLGGLQSSWPF